MISKLKVLYGLLLKLRLRLMFIISSPIMQMKCLC